MFDAPPSVAETASRRDVTNFQELYQSLVETLPVHILCKDREGAVIFGNSSLCALFGKPLEELLGKTDLDLFPPELAAKYRRDDQQVMTSGHVFEAVEQHQTPDGERIYVQVFKVPLRNPAGDVSGVQCMFWDITGRKQAEEQVREQAAMLDRAQDAIVVLDLENRVRFWNKAAERLWGWTAEKANGHRPVSDVGFKEPAMLQTARGAVFDRGEWAGELRLDVKGKGELAVSSRWTLVRDAEGNPKALLVINSDITEKKKLEAQFLRAQRMEGLGMLASGIAHDLNNILSPILMAVPFLREGRTQGAEMEKILDLIEINTRRGVEVVKQLLTFGRGTLDQRIALQPRQLVIEILKLTQDTFPKNILVKTQVSDALWTIMGDPTQLHQLMLNLCLNARDAMPHGGILTVAAENLILDDCYATQNIEAAAGPYVVLKVIDGGTGIAPEILPKIFDPFFTTKPVGQGSGLGLSTVLGIARGHGGFVKVYSEPGQGTTFAAYLPAAPEASVAETRPKPEIVPRGQGECILVVDDEKPLLEMTQKVLERQGYEVLTASEGTEALALFAPRRDKIQVVLTDVSMPVMDGVSLVRILKKMEPGLNVIAASGRGSGGKASDLKALGVEKFLAKPYAAEKLMLTLHELLHEKTPNGVSRETASEW